MRRAILAAAALLPIQVWACRDAPSPWEPPAEEIPLGARIVALADAFDAIVRGRPYRAARTMEEAYDELRKHSGTQFDPGLVPLFIEETDRDGAGIAPSVELPRVALLGQEAPIVTGAPSGAAAARVA